MAPRSVKARERYRLAWICSFSSWLMREIASSICWAARKPSADWLRRYCRPTQVDRASISPRRISGSPGRSRARLP